MAKFGPFTNGYLTVNGVNLSDHVKSLTVQQGANLGDESAMGDTTQVNRAGVLTWSISATFIQDFAALSVDATLSPLIGAAAFPIACRPLNAAQSATNPTWSGSAVLQDYQPIAGSHGDVPMIAAATFVSAGTLTRTAS
jgi:hypothetical protein